MQPLRCLRVELPATAVVCSYRLGGTDGVAIEAAKWIAALEALGVAVRTVAGAGRADIVLPGLAAGASEPVLRAELEAAFDGAELAIVENLCSLPLNPAASAAVADVLRDRAAVLHHHDLASQRRALAHLGPPPDDPAWLHVCVNRRTTTELRARGYAAVTLYNAFDPFPPLGDRELTRARLGVGPSDLLVVQPTRAIARKGVAAGIALAESLGATYWLLGPAEDGYDEECAAILGAARCPVAFGPEAGRTGHEIEDAYSASDLITLPSTWEGFGNPAIESATHRRPLAIGPYPVAAELRRFGFSWFDVDAPGVVAQWMELGDDTIIDTNALVARRHFSLDDLPRRLTRCLAQLPARSKRRNPPREQGMLATGTQQPSTIGGE